jgi:hypothetical protein
MTYQQLWPFNTFIGDISNEFDEEDRKGLIETGKKYVEKYPHTFDVLDPKITLPGYNMFNDSCKYVQKFKKIFLEKVLNLARLEEHPYIDDVEVEAILLARRFSGNGSGQTPHYHRGVDYTSVFYADLDNIKPKNTFDSPGNGDLYLVDPVSNRPFAFLHSVVKRIPVYPGLLVVHPSSIAHSTDTYYGEKEKCLFVSNARLIEKRYGPHYSKITY